jgi:hypothetical protein
MHIDPNPIVEASNSRIAQGCAARLMETQNKSPLVLNSPKNDNNILIIKELINYQLDKPTTNGLNQCFLNGNFRTRIL